MQAFAARRFAKADQSERFQPIMNFSRSLDHRGETYVRRRIEIENYATGYLRLSRLTVPRMQFESG